MIKNFIKSAFRNLWKTKGYSFLNIFGLALGITVTALIFLWVQDELSYNDYFSNKKDIYVAKSKQTYDGNINVFGATPGPFAKALKKDIPGILNSGRIDWGNTKLFTVGDKKIYQSGNYVDPEILSILNPEFLAGDAKTALDNPSSIVLSESTAKRFFNDDNPVGKTIKFDNNQVYTVSAVTKDFPKNTNFRYDWLLNFKILEANKDFGYDFWGNNSIQTIVQLEPNADLNAVNAKVKNYIAEINNDKEANSENFLYPMERWRMYDRFEQGIEKDGRIKNVRLFTSIAWLVLLIACINFMNLSTARSEKRAKEVSMRKIVGAKKGSLIMQFLGESIVFAFVAGILAIGMVKLGLPTFNTMVNKELAIDFGNWQQIGFISAIILVVGIISGSYPAFFLSSFDPLTTLKGGKRKAGSSNLIRKGLVITQFTAAIILMICTSVIYLQIQFAKNRDLGFDRSQVIMTNILGDMSKHIPVIKQELKATGNVETVGLSRGSVLQVGSNTSSFEWDGKDPKSSILIGFSFVDEDFVDALSMKIMDGRTFRPNLLGDSSSVLINESMAKLIQPDGRVAGKLIKFQGEALTVAGVVKNYVYNSIYDEAEPLVLAPLALGKAYGVEAGILNIKTKPGVDFPKVLKEIEGIVKKYNPDFPFNYTFLDDDFNNYFSSEMMLQKLASLFSILAIIISCLGLLGLAAFSAEQRAREVSIRKVLGASVGRLVRMLNTEFIILVGISCLIAYPIAWWFMQDWLKGYNYHMDMPWMIFLMVAGLAIVIALFTISTQALRAATSNPTKTLRNE
ncbi:ABC transporter permease [Sphingobacterium mizutaii NBRC 14946 = DSM 11724]|uniref:Macrolide export ATP-binding/permease protein MacB n=2 Tax=Sphingobacterium mizutaii TaxID=1010 RepID=A0AAJ5BZ58_9SPHI|nr:ABC transporter permease [Sphingobacterium mizutaii]GEM68606.1 ABC transporter permease [Sphingobacterium mizutaii NBRC 14946 = DSM 11724]SDL36275.1 duplicated orphan permease [Sphingobacterium mizutaii]SNV42979.1 Macrolide export ATP-binding/permease protein MacB [Sphingobacterium mizutaii]